MPALSVALALALGQVPPPQLAQPGSTATLTAKNAEFESETHRVKAQGDVELRTGGIAVRADALEYDTETREGTASGSVTAVDGNLVAVGREASFSLLGEMRLTVRWADLFQKLAGERPTLERVRDPQSARSFGHNAFVIRAEELERAGPGHVKARSMRISSCDCAGAAPDWSIGAKRADLLAGERALLYWAAFYVKDIPVLPLPVLYIPLSERRTGFLMPRPGFIPGGGFAIDEPFFLTLGRSWDLTLEGGYHFGADQKTKTLPDGSEVAEQRVGTRGVRLAAELRYAPSDTTAGRLKVMAIDDRHCDVAANGSLLGPRGWRGELLARHSTVLRERVLLRADVNLVSDRNLLTDEPLDAVVGTFQTWTRSLALGEVIGRGVLLGGAATFYQDLGAAQAQALVRPDTRVMGQGAAVTLQRPGLAFFDVPPARLLGPVNVGLEASVARYQPFSLFTGPAPSQIVSRTRAVATPTASWSPFTGGPLRGEVYGWLRAEASAIGGGSDSEPASGLSGRGVAGAYVGTELSRIYGGLWRHTIAPRLEVRALTGRFGEPLKLVGSPGCQVSSHNLLADQAVIPRDEYDLLPAQACNVPGTPVPPDSEPRVIDLPMIPESARVEGVASVTTRLQRRGGGDVARLEVGQDYDLREGQAADLFGRLDLLIGRLSLTAQGRYDWLLHKVAFLSAQVGLSDARGDAVSARYDWLLGTLTDQLRSTVDDLFGPRAIPAEAMSQGVDVNQIGSRNTVSLGASAVVFKGLSLNGAAFIAPNPPEGSPVVTLLSGGVVLGRTCNECWRLEVGGTLSPSTTDFFAHGGVRVLLELKNLGAFGN
jgi:LPS-assembly protein